MPNATTSSIAGQVDDIMNANQTYTTLQNPQINKNSIENDTFMQDTIFMTEGKERLPDIGSYDLISEVVDEITEVSGKQTK